MATDPTLGPFGQYLTQSLEPSPIPKPTGLEGTGGNIAFIASNFLNGMKQAKAQRFAMEQAKQAREEQAYQTAMQHVAASGLPEDEKQHLITQLTIPLVQRIAADKDATTKNTGNHLTDFIKGMATNLVGGNLPKKQEPLDMGLVTQTLLHAADPANSAVNRANIVDQRANSIISQIVNNAKVSGKTLTDADILGNEQLNNLSAEHGRLTGGKPMPSLALALNHIPKAIDPLEQAKLDYLKTFTDEPKPTSQPLSTQPQTATPPQAQSTTTPPVTAPSVATQTATPPVAPTVVTPSQVAPPNKIDLPALHKENTMGHMLTGTEPNKIGQVASFLMPDGTVKTGMQVNSRNFNGIVDTEGNPLSGARPASQKDLEKPKPEEMAALTEATHKALDTAVGPDFAKPYHAQIDIVSKQFDKASLDNVIQQAISHKQASDIAQRTADERKTQDAFMRNIQQENADTRRFVFAEKQVDDISKPIVQAMDRIDKLNMTLKQGTGQADALVAPELLQMTSGGIGSQFRMNEAEIERVVGGRSAWEKLKVTLGKINPADSETFRLIGPVQSKQIRALVTEFADRIQKQDEVRKELNERLATANSSQEQNKIILDAKNKLAAINVAGLPTSKPPVGTAIIAPPRRRTPLATNGVPLQ